MSWNPQCPIVTPDPVRLTLSHGRYLDVRNELNTGEHRKMISDQFKETHAADGGALSLALNKIGMNRVTAYVLGWSFVNLDGRPLAFSEDALNSFDFGTWQEILVAVDAHHATSEAALAARKNDLGIASELPVTSLSPLDATGVLTTSAP